MKFTPKIYALGLIAALEGEESPQPIIRNFLSLLWKKKHFRLLPKITRIIEEELDQHNGIMKIDVRYPEKCAANLADLKKEMEKIFKKEIFIKEIADDELIGGYKIRYGEFLIDASVSQQLQRLKENFLKNNIS